MRIATSVSHQQLKDSYNNIWQTVYTRLPTTETYNQDRNTQRGEGGEWTLLENIWFVDMVQEEEEDSNVVIKRLRYGVYITPYYFINLHIVDEVYPFNYHMKVQLEFYT